VIALEPRPLSRWLLTAANAGRRLRPLSSWMVAGVRRERYGLQCSSAEQHRSSAEQIWAQGCSEQLGLELTAGGEYAESRRVVAGVASRAVHYDEYSLCATHSDAWTSREWISPQVSARPAILARLRDSPSFFGQRVNGIRGLLT
jgi:hypothetical protein